MSPHFATTRWSVILSAKEVSTSEARDALESLCSAYWPPLYAFVRRQGYGVDDAHDLTQAFFARLLEKRYLDVVHPSRGRFRSFLLVSMRHFLSDERDRERARKRGGGKELLSLDAEAAERGYRVEAREELTPEAIYERRWARTVVDRAHDRLAQEQIAAGKGTAWSLLGPHLTEPEGNPGYREIAEALDSTQGAVKVAVHRLRKRFGALLREEVAQTVADEDQVDDEIRHLLSILQGTP